MSKSMNRGKNVNKDYVRAEEGLIDAIEFHKKYHAPITFYTTFSECRSYPCRMTKDDREFYGIRE